MSTYTKITDFAAKDALLTGNPSKIVKGTEIGAEFDSIASADASNVKGPTSAVTDNAVVRWDTTTGRLAQGSGVTISDSDVVTASGFAGPLNGTVGATTPSAGAFTTLSASSTITGTQGTAYGFIVPNSGAVRSPSNGVLYISADTGNAYASSSISFDIDGVIKATLDTSGNLGLGVVPSAWGTLKAVEVASGAYLAGAGVTLYAGANNYYNGTNYIYKTSDAASQYQQIGGRHQWYNAPSGTAGNAITFTQAMALDASGNLQLNNAAYYQGKTSAGTATRMLGINASNVVYVGSVDTTLSGGITLVNNGVDQWSQAGIGRTWRLPGGADSLGTGIAFPATQLASSDANTLDDYEEGTFTPTIVGTTTAGTGTYSSQLGRYTKVGNRVYFDLQVVWTAHTGTGNMVAGGLPFTSGASAFSVLPVYSSNLTFPGQLAAVIGNSSSQVVIRTIATGAVAADLAIDTAAEVRFSGHYEV